MREHSLVRATVTPQIVTILSRYYKTNRDKALRRFYTSKTAANYADDETGLYGQSALFIAGMFIMEHDGQIDLERLAKITSGHRAKTKNRPDGGSGR